jgi:hypothetical protein
MTAEHKQGGVFARGHLKSTDFAFASETGGPLNPATSCLR